MIDYFALALSHALIVVALVRMLGRDGLDGDEAAPADGRAAAGPGTGPGA